MPDETQESTRFARRQERRELVRSFAPARVRVIPRDDVIRKLLKHPKSGGFPLTGSVEWPHDQFTKRRLGDGDITIEEAQAEPETRAVPRTAKVEDPPPAEQPKPAS